MKIAIISSSKIASSNLVQLFDTIFDDQIVWTAWSTSEVLMKCEKNPPDLILMDLDGFLQGCAEITKIIMHKYPCAILLLCSSIDQNLSKIFEVMGQGALDVLNIDLLKVLKNAKSSDELLKKIETIAKLMGKNVKKEKKTPPLPLPFKHKETQKMPSLLLIGASTGGPSALCKIISSFPSEVNFATVIIQHVDAKFSKGLAKWLGQHTSIPVKVAEKGSRPTRGEILIPGVNEHMVMTPQLDFQYTPAPSDSLYHPSIDALFNSIAKYWPNKSIATLLTGMGNDGAKGLKNLQLAGWHTIVEHQKSCVVYGMPKAAIDLGAAVEVLEIDQIGPSILAFVGTT